MALVLGVMLETAIVSTASLVSASRRPFPAEQGYLVVLFIVST
jgi:hypothetical protein